MFLLISIASIFALLSSLNKKYDKKNLYTLFFAVTSILLIQILLISQFLSDGQDFQKYYDLVSSRTSLYNAVNFYSFEILFWVPQYLLALSFDGETWRDINILILFFISCFIFTGSDKENKIHSIVLCYMIIWSFPGTYLLYGNAYRQLLMVFVLLLFFKKHKFILSILSTLIHKSAFIHIIILLFNKFPKTIFFIIVPLTCFLINYLNLYNTEETNFDFSIIFVYGVFSLLISIIIKDFNILYTYIIILLITITNDIIGLRLLLSFGPIIAFYIINKYSYKKSFLQFFSILALLVNLFLYFMRPTSIKLLYQSVI